MNNRLSSKYSVVPVIARSDRGEAIPCENKWIASPSARNDGIYRMFTFSRGFSLLEIIVAMLILSLVVAGLFGLFVTSHSYIIEAGHRLQAINYARQVAETLKVYRSAADVPTGATAAFTAGSHNSTSLGLPPPAIDGATGVTCTYTVSDDPQGAAGLKQVTITETWTEP